MLQNVASAPSWGGTQNNKQANFRPKHYQTRGSPLATRNATLSKTGKFGQARLGTKDYAALGFSTP